MKIGIGTSDGVRVCDHLARSAEFLIFEVTDGRVAGKSVRRRGEGPCGNHASFVEMLEGCGAVLCGGIGQGAVNSLVAAGIQPLVLKQPQTVEGALADYLEGRLATTEERQCLCGPDHRH